MYLKDLVKFCEDARARGIHPLTPVLGGQEFTSVGVDRLTIEHQDGTHVRIYLRQDASFGETPQDRIG